MRLAVALLIAACFAPDVAEAEHAQFIRVHKEWLRLHEQTSDAQAELVIDPRHNAMWIEDDGNAHDTFAVDLPPGLRWYAFHITQAGIVERSFPVRLTNPRSDIHDESKEEQLWVIGVAENRSHQISFSASRSGTGFHVGSGSMIGDVTFRLPAALPDERTIKFNSFLASQSPRSMKSRELISKDEFSVLVARRRTPPNVE